MRINILNYIEATDTLVVMCDGHLITHVSGGRPCAMNNLLPISEGMCDRDVALALLFAEAPGFEPREFVGMSMEYIDPRQTVRFTGHTGSLISYAYDGEEKHVAIDSLALMHAKIVSGDDMTLDLEKDLLACAYETFILNGNMASIIGCEVTPLDLEVSPDPQIEDMTAARDALKDQRADDANNYQELRTLMQNQGWQQRSTGNWANFKTQISDQPTLHRAMKAAITEGNLK